MFNGHHHIVQSYDKELSDITEIIINMGKKVTIAIEISMSTIKGKENDLSAQAIENDNDINNLDTQLEQKSLSLLALRQPMGVDLRFIVTAIKIATILERVGDLAKHVTCRMSLIDVNISIQSLGLIEKVHNILLEMINNVLLAFSKRDDNLAMVVCDQDKELDLIYDKLLTLLKSEISCAPQNVESIMQVIFAAKNYERIGDYMVKFAKHIYFVVNGSFPNKNK